MLGIIVVEGSRRLDCRSSSFVGLGLLFSLKVEQTYETAPLTVLLARRP